MKLLKKITLLLLTGALIFALAACGNSNQTPDAPSNGATSADRISCWHRETISFPWIRRDIILCVPAMSPV